MSLKDPVGPIRSSSENEFEYDLTKKDKNTLNLLLLCKLDLTIDNLWLLQK